MRGRFEDIDWSSRFADDDARTRIIQLHKEERFALAAKLLPDSLTSHPDDGFAWFVFGDCLRMLQRPRLAKNALLKCVEITPSETCWPAIARIAMILGKCGELAEADRYYELALQNKEANEESWVWIFRGDNLRKLERLEEAVQCYEMADKIEPNVAEVSFSLAKIAAAQGSYSDARRLCERALRLAPDDADAMDLLKFIDGA
jgi:tetratricopeptide (TPR) repeat protein